MNILYVTRADLIGQYVGHSHLKTVQILSQAADIIFIESLDKIILNACHFYECEVLFTIQSHIQTNKRLLVIFQDSSPINDPKISEICPALQIYRYRISEILMNIYLIFTFNLDFIPNELRFLIVSLL